MQTPGKFGTRAAPLITESRGIRRNENKNESNERWRFKLSSLKMTNINVRLLFEGECHGVGCF